MQDYNDFERGISEFWETDLIIKSRKNKQGEIVPNH